MKVHILAALLCTISLNSFAAEKKDENPHLKFNLDDALRIKGAEEHGGMKFLVPASEFMGKVITDAVPLEEGDRKKLQDALKAARIKGDSQEVVYKLQAMFFLAHITHDTDENSFSVKVTESK